MTKRTYGFRDGKLVDLAEYEAAQKDAARAEMERIYTESGFRGAGAMGVGRTLDDAWRDLIRGQIEMRETALETVRLYPPPRRRRR